MNATAATETTATETATFVQQTNDWFGDTNTAATETTATETATFVQQTNDWFGDPIEAADEYRALLQGNFFA